MKYKTASQDEPYRKWQKSKEWHPFFAWYPVRTAEYEMTWLETVERRRVCHRFNCKFEYRIITN